MMTSMKRMAVMSAALILLCVSAMAQNEKSTKNATYSFSGVTIDKTHVDLTPGETQYVTITPNDGYYNVTIYYNNDPYIIDQPIVGKYFTAKFSGTVNYGGILEITANNDALNDKEKVEHLGVGVETIPEDMWKMLGIRSSATITITIKSSDKN